MKQLAHSTHLLCYVEFSDILFKESGITIYLRQIQLKIYMLAEKRLKLSDINCGYVALSEIQE